MAEGMPDHNNATETARSQQSGQQMAMKGLADDACSALATSPRQRIDPSGFPRPR